MTKDLTKKMNSDFNAKTDYLLIQIGEDFERIYPGWSWKSLISLGYRYDIFSFGGKMKAIGGLLVASYLIAHLYGFSQLIGIALATALVATYLYFGMFGNVAFIRAIIESNIWHVVMKRGEEKDALDNETGNLPEQSAKSNVSVTSSSKIHENRIEIFDSGFGYKMSWATILPSDNSISSRELFSVTPKICLLDEATQGIYEDRKKVCFIEMKDGRIIIAGFAVSKLFDEIGNPQKPGILSKIISNSSNVQMYRTHRVSETHAWAIFNNGELVRYYSSADGDTHSFGKQSSIEEEILKTYGYEAFSDESSPEDGPACEKYEVTEEVVVQLSAALGINTLSLNQSQIKSVALVELDI